MEGLGRRRNHEAIGNALKGPVMKAEQFWLTLLPPWWVAVIDTRNRLLNKGTGHNWVEIQSVTTFSEAPQAKANTEEIPCQPPPETRGISYASKRCL